MPKTSCFASEIYCTAHASKTSYRTNHLTKRNFGKVPWSINSCVWPKSTSILSQVDGKKKVCMDFSRLTLKLTFARNNRKHPKQRKMFKKPPLLLLQRLLRVLKTLFGISDSIVTRKFQTKNFLAEKGV